MESITSKQKFIYQELVILWSQMQWDGCRYKPSFSPSASGYVFSEISCLLGLAGIDLIFFTAAGMMLRFRFVTKTVLLMHWCFSCSWTASRPYLFLILLSQWIAWEWARGWEGSLAQPVRQPEPANEIFHAK